MRFLLKIRIEDRDYRGTPVEILDQLRMEADRGIPNVAEYIRFVQDNIQLVSGQPCTLNGGSTEKRALSLIERLEALYALEVVEE